MRKEKLKIIILQVQSERVHGLERNAWQGSILEVLNKHVLLQCNVCVGL
jgi:septum formation topological specificity factor MinE